MNSDFSSYIALLAERYGQHVSDYLLDYYRQKGIETTLEDRYNHVKEDLGFQPDSSLELKSFVQCCEICGILAERFPEIFAVCMPDPELN